MCAWMEDLATFQVVRMNKSLGPLSMKRILTDRLVRYSTVQERVERDCVCRDIN